MVLYGGPGRDLEAGKELLKNRSFVGVGCATLQNRVEEAAGKREEKEALDSFTAKLRVPIS